MELPKNITQVGESDQRCKIYAEDYVISYMKQLNRQAGNKSTAIALYGTRKEEDGISYVFFYGAVKVNSFQREVRHLSQAQTQEIEKLRKRFFPQYQFMGYRLLDGEMVEGFHIYDQGTCRYIAGYACFYEKNDAMLAYMLDSRKEEVPPETVDQEKFERVRLKQEERRAQYRGSIGYGNDKKEESSHIGQAGHPEEKKHQIRRTARESRGITAMRSGTARRTAGARQPGKKVAPYSLKLMKTAVVGLFLILCALGIVVLNDLGSAEDIQAAARKLIAEFTEQKLPDEEASAESRGETDTLVTEDKLTEAIRQENEVGQASQPSEQVPETEPSAVSSGESASESSGGQPSEPSSESTAEATPEPSSEQPNESSAEQSEEQQEPSSSAAPEPSTEASSTVTYTIRRGDTLTAISFRYYGTDAKVREICELNGISNPDNIRFGQKILLP